jgi:hypothetical protein
MRRLPAANSMMLVMAGLVPAIHVLFAARPEDVDARVIGERSDAVLRTAMPGHDESQPVTFP